ncbi:hypothetical protein AKJ55_00640 [candidate division MSBL1 archaeon SCGC-AAA382M17]|uniref:Uncharacterized protein n=1 Tax=candidate division MSBL1 archaeon SCGC-AAA382M17 TaxID=1698284 RepID=A0ABR5TKL7_9EURY|nr:hypothetical protein AKJ55_00640 [candidate division MSBL1 archaeon SCGC-AAA382M17]
MSRFKAECTIEGCEFREGSHWRNTARGRSSCTSTGRGGAATVRRVQPPNVGSKLRSGGSTGSDFFGPSSTPVPVLTGIFKRVGVTQRTSGRMVTRMKNMRHGRGSSGTTCLKHAEG